MPDDDQQQQQQPPINLADPAALTAAYSKYLEYLQQVGNQRPAQAPVISQAQLDANRPTSLLGQLGEALGGGAPSDVPMTSDQRERAGIRGLFNFSRGLLGTGTFDTIGQALDRGFTEAERGQYNQEAQVAYGQAAAQDWQRQQMADRLAALKESIPLLQGIQRLNMPSLYGPGGGPGAQAGGGGVPGTPGAPGVATAFTGDKTKDLALIKQRESGGDYGIMNYVARADPSAVARGATASGAYQIVDSTWREGMQLAGLDPSKYAHAKDAPPAVQDQVASALYDKYGTRPWDPSKFGANWVQQPGGGYQLVKGAPYSPPSSSAPYQVAGPVVAPPSQPPAAPGGASGPSALPVPPVPPSGAQPSPEPAGPGGAPSPTEMATAEPRTLKAPPPGQVVTPGGEVSPASGPQPPPGAVPPAPQQPAPAQQAPQQPPAQPQTTQATPPPKIATTPEEYAALHPANGLDQPDKATIQHDAQAVAAAQQQLDQIRRGYVQGDATKAQDAVQAALNAQADHIANAKEKYWSTVVMPGFKAEQDRQLETQKATWRPMEPSDFAAHNITPEPGVTYLINPLGETKIQQTPIDPRLQKLAEIDANTFNTDFQQPHIELMRLRPLMDQMDALRQQMIRDGSMNTGATGDTIRHLQGILVSAGLGTEGMREGLSNAQAYQALAQQLVLAMKQNTGLSRITNYDLQILQQQIPGMYQSAGGQQLISGLLRQLWDYQDKVYGAASSSLHDRSTGYTLSGLDERVGKLPEAIPKLPAEALPQNGKGGWNTDQFTQWRQAHGLQKGQVIRMPNGDYQMMGN